VEAAARMRPSGENAWPHCAPDKPADSTASRAGCCGRVTFHRAAWARPPPALVATVAPSGEIAAGLPPSNTDSRHGRAWPVMFPQGAGGLPRRAAGGADHDALIA
jgi:hypothetical protein